MVMNTPKSVNGDKNHMNSNRSLFSGLNPMMQAGKKNTFPQLGKFQFPIAEGENGLQVPNKKKSNPNHMFGSNKHIRTLAQYNDMRAERIKINRIEDGQSVYNESKKLRKFPIHFEG